MMESPVFLLLLLLLIPVTGVLFLWYGNHRPLIASIVGKWRSRGILAGMTTMWFVRGIAFTLFITCIVLSLAGFKWGKEVTKDERTGLDIALVFDVSRSMLAEDVPPSRFRNAKRIAVQIINQNLGDRMGVTAFRGEGVKVLPMTEDATSLIQFLDTMNIDIVTTPGTDLEKGLKAGLSLFPSGLHTKRTVVVFTDGEFHSGNPKDVLMSAESERTTILFVGIGSEEGGVIPLADGGTVKNESGETVITRLDRTFLEGIAESYGNVETIMVTNREQEKKLFKKIQKIHADGSEEQFVVKEKKRYRLFLLSALLFLALYITAGLIRWNPKE